MGLFVSTTGLNVAIPELGITIVDPTTDRNMGSQFSSDEIERAASLTTAIQAGTLVWRKVAAGAIQPAADYDSNFLEIDEENTGPGQLNDRVVTFKDLPAGSSLGSPVALTPDSGNIDGVATSVARSDHQHNVPTAAAVTLDSTSTNAQGAASTFARSNHTHAVTSAAPIAQTPDNANAAGSAAGFAKADHVHNVPTGTPSTIGTANAQGAAAAFARQDHVHNHGAQTVGTLHAVATTSVAGFMSATDKTKLDAIVSKSGIVASGTFAGNPKKATVTFATAFASANYNISITGVDARTWTIESKVAASFIINANANTALTGDVYWQAMLNGEAG
jgi:hypothetical protein